MPLFNNLINPWKGFSIVVLVGCYLASLFLWSELLQLRILLGSIALLVLAILYLWWILIPVVGMLANINLFLIDAFRKQSFLIIACSTLFLVVLECFLLTKTEFSRVSLFNFQIYQTVAIALIVRKYLRGRREIFTAVYSVIFGINIAVSLVAFSWGSLERVSLMALVWENTLEPLFPFLFVGIFILALFMVLSAARRWLNGSVSFRDEF